ncbi:IS110 family transposase [Mangrovicoccus ximenensis]|uniref:IS110 family transposase n=1 Tax=Mangrovicoccus ximenensis TaxID=1911570 RepID=UPI00191BE2EA|nr:transposase [Mangrovicoccus ximenensis]
MTNRTIGIDLATRGDHVAQIHGNGRPVGRPVRFRHDAASLDAFLARAIEGIRTGDGVLAVMEPTGMSWFPVAHRLADSGIAATRVKGKRVRALRRHLSEHAKTDLADAQVLAASPGFGGPELDPLHSPAPKSHALQRLTKQRSRFRDAIAAAKRRLLGLIRWASPALERVLPDLGTRLPAALLQRWVDPEVTLKARKTTIATFIARHASGNPPMAAPSPTPSSRGCAGPPAKPATCTAGMSAPPSCRQKSPSRPAS